MSDQIASQPKTPEEKFYDDLLNNHHFNRPDKRSKQFNKTIGRESVFIKKLNRQEKKKFNTTKDFLITKFRPDQLNETTKKIKEGAKVKCLFFNLAKKDDDDFLNILKSGTFDYEDGTKDTNYEVKTVSIPKKMNYSLTSNDNIQDNNQTNNSEPVKSDSLMKLDEEKEGDDDDDDDALTSLKPQGSSFGRDEDDDDDDDEKISKEIEVVGMPNFNSPPPSKPNKEIEENRRYKRKMSKIENPKSDDEFDDDDDDDDNNNSVVQYDKEADRIDGDMEKSEKALSVYSRRINDKPKQNITNTSVSVFAPGFNSRPKAVIPKLPTLPSEIINGRDEIIERIDTLERRNYKEISKLKKQYKTFNTLLGNLNGMIDLAKSTNAQQQEQSLQVITQSQESIKGLYQDVMTGAMQQLASSFNTVNQKEDALALGLQNLQQSQQDSQQAYQQALLSYSNSTNSSLQTLGSEVAKINTNIRELSQKPTPAIQNNVIIPKEATNHITSTVHKQIESSLGPFGEDIKLLKQGLKILDETTKKLIEYKPPQQYSGIVEESPDEIISGVNLKLDELLRKLLVRMANYKRFIVKKIDQQNQDLQGQLVPLQTSIQSTEERVLKSIKDNIDSSIVLIRTNNEDLFNSFISGLDEKYTKYLYTALQPVLDQGRVENEKLDGISKPQNDNLLLSKSINENTTKLIEDSQKVPAKMIEGVKELQEKATGVITSHVSTETGKVIKLEEETKSAVLDQSKKLGEIKTEIGQIVQFQTNKTYNTEILEAIKKLSSDINEQIALAIKQGNKELVDTLKAYNELLRKIFEEQAKYNEEIKLLKKEREERRKQKDEQRKQDKIEYQLRFSELKDDIKDILEKSKSNGNNNDDDDDDDDDEKKENEFDGTDVDSKGYIKIRKEKPDIVFGTFTKDGTRVITEIMPDLLGSYLFNGNNPNNPNNSNNSKSPESLLKLIVKAEKNSNGKLTLEDIGEIQDLDGEITDLYSQLLSIKSDIKEAEKKGDTLESDKLKVKYNKKREELNKRISRYSKELYKLSETKKKTKATFASHKYLMNKLNKL